MAASSTMCWLVRDLFTAMGLILSYLAETKVLEPRRG